MSLNHNSTVQSVQFMQLPMSASSASAPASGLSSKLLHSWYEHEDERCISGVVQDEDLGYDIHTITGARPSIYKEILQGLEDMKLACMWNESEWRDYAYDRRSYSYSSYTNSCASDQSSVISDLSDLNADSLTDGSDQYDGMKELESVGRLVQSSKVETEPRGTSPDTDAFMHLYKGYQKYAYY